MANNPRTTLEFKLETIRWALALLLALFFAAGCDSSSEEEETDSDTSSDVDTDGDTDSDTDADSDTDTDSDTDVDSDTDADSDGVLAPVIEVLIDDDPAANNSYFSFGSFPVDGRDGEKSDLVEFKIGNVGNAGLRVNEVLILDDKKDGSSDYMYDKSAIKSLLKPGESTTFTLTFDPLIAGNLTAKIEIHHDAPVGSPYTIHLTGVGTSEE